MGINLEETKNFLKTKGHVFTACITKNSIIRQFIKRSLNEIPSKMITIIPRNNHFYEAEYWQSEIFMETGKMNECMHLLITNKMLDNKQNHCSEKQRVER